ncbi:exonuclease domain-containing protein [Pullulanibacillus sp. KACC 23026]|uniref:exonuclease domain-containing protein n=1 Tax=Pullulanibacillus sp. KACC 23026 TaxID=3028315 RepID=UPI0023AF1329|nr:exonuclease domain-containing protein [Pullulanibacillus sp. KACC 23026]WEG11796.1 exonuclease domain-containing protein [Pullulanibacillus sp. KACC 23026]
MSDAQDRSWITRFLSIGLRPDQLFGTVRSGSLQQEAYVRQLLKETHQKRLALETPLQNVTFILLDTETTGFNADSDDIFAFSATKTKMGKPYESYSTLIKPSQPIPDAIQALTGINQEDVRFAPSMEDILPKLLQFLTDGIILGYHIAFDLTFLNAYLKANNQRRLPHQSFELRQLIEKLYQQSFPTLDDALAFFNIPCEKRHTAEGDVKAMADLWSKLYDRFQELHLATLYDLYALVGR